MEISALIVDDDKLLARKLEETLDWQGIGVSAVFTSNNIRQARRILEELPIQLLLCDIDMPQGSGLELLEWIREKNIPVECVFLSSYANFAYVQKALALSSREYLLKPISNDELEKSLRRLVGEIAAKEPRTIREAMQPEKESFWQNFVLGTGGEKLLENACRDGLYRPDEAFCFCAARLGLDSAQEGYKKELTRFYYMIRSHVPGVLEKQGITLEADIPLGDFERLFVLKAHRDPLRTREGLEALARYCGGIMPLRCCLYASHIRPFLEAEICLEQVERLLSHAVLDDAVLVDEDALDAMTTGYTPPPWDILLREMTDNPGKAHGELLEYFNGQAALRRWSAKTMAQFGRELAQLLYRYLNDQGIRFGNLFDSEEFGRMEQGSQQSLGGMREFMAYSFHKLEGNRHGFGGEGESVVESLKRHIESNLRGDLSRKALAGRVFLSEVYVSRLFAQETGTSIPAYVTSRRIEKAREFLERSSMPISKIAMEVGYSNFSYFSKSFRDIVGCTPNEYRNRLSR